MNEDIHPDIKTAQHIMITEFLLFIAFCGLALWNSFTVYIAVGLVLISITVNIFWIVRLFINKPPKYIAYVAGLSLPITALFILVMWVLGELSKIQC